ncbi:MAG: YfiR family protein [Gemmatimonadales bacterium]|nr:YfiR family protein [Gemmatimonadales bacterium]
MTGMIKIMRKNRKSERPAAWYGGRKILALVFALCLLAGWNGQAAAENNSDGTENLIRSAMIYNFCKFVQWPESDLDTLVLGVMAAPDATLDFSSIQGKAVHDSYIKVRPVRSSEDLAGCQLVFIPKGMEGQLQGAFAAAQAESILTISEIDGFCSQGGIIQLVERRGKLRFFINNKAANESRLTLSSQLLKMAKIVEGG